MGLFLSWPIAVALALKLKKKIEDTAMIAVTLMIVLMFITSFFVGIQVGTFFVLLFGGLSTCYCLYKFIRDRKMFFDVTISPGGIVFAVLLCFFAATNMGRGIIGTDAPSYWGVLLKKYYYTNSLRDNLQTTHPGTIPLLAVFAEKTWIGYADSMALLAIDVLMISLVLPMLRFATGKYKIAKTFMLVVLIILIPLSMWYRTYDTFLGDGPISLAVGAMAVSIYAYFSSKDRVFLCQILSEMYLITSTKRIGIVLASCMLAVFLFVYWKNEPELEGEKKAGIVYSFVIMCCPLITYFMWKGASIYLILPPAMAMMVICVIFVINNWEYLATKIVAMIASVSLCVVIRWIFANILIVDDLSKASTINFFKAVLSEKDIYWGSSIKLSLAKIILLFVCLLFTVRYKAKSFSNKNNRLFYHEGVALIPAMTAYVGLLCITYATRIAPANEGFGQYVPGIERYLLGCFFAFIMLSFYWLMHVYSDLVGVLFSCIIIVFMTDLSFLSDYILLHPEPVKFYGFENAGIELTEDDDIYFIQETPSDVEYNVRAAFIYDMYPANCNVKNEFTYTNEKNPEERVTPQEFSRILNDGGYDYVYIQNSYEDFADYYSDIIQDNGDSVVSGSVFAVEETNGKVTLRFLD